MLDETVADDEYLYRGVVESCWDEAENRPSSAAFKDSNGISVNRDGGRSKDVCVGQLLVMKSFRAVCRLTAGDVRECEAVVKYLPVEDNEYHSEIHDSLNQIEIKSKSKQRKLKGKSEIVYCRN